MHYKQIKEISGINKVFHQRMLVICYHIRLTKSRDPERCPQIGLFANERQVGRGARVKGQTLRQIEEEGEEVGYLLCDKCCSREMVKEVSPRFGELARESRDEGSRNLDPTF